jgi:hypothetical protein
VMRGAGLATLVALVGMLLMLRRRDRARVDLQAGDIA